MVIIFLIIFDNSNKYKYKIQTKFPDVWVKKPKNNFRVVEFGQPKYDSIPYEAAVG